MWNPKDWKFCITNGQNPPWHMDQTHVKMVYQEALKFKTGRIMEIGSYAGYSSSAFVQAINEGCSFELHLVDPQPDERLLKVINKCKKKKNIVLHTCPSHEVKLMCDLVLIDGHHGAPAIGDLAQALAYQTKTIIMHDSQTYHLGLADCWGAALAADILKTATNREWVEDKKKRRGEFTERGLLISHEKFL